MRASTTSTSTGPGIAVDGDFGPATLHAVRSFQSSVAIAVDGLVGPQTKAKLYSDITSGGEDGAPAPINLNSSSCPANIQQGQRPPRPRNHPRRGGPRPQVRRSARAPSDQAQAGTDPVLVGHGPAACGCRIAPPNTPS